MAGNYSNFDFIDLTFVKIIRVEEVNIFLCLFIY